MDLSALRTASRRRRASKSLVGAIPAGVLSTRIPTSEDVLLLDAGGGRERSKARWASVGGLNEESRTEMQMEEVELRAGLLIAAASITCQSVIERRSELRVLVVAERSFRVDEDAHQIAIGRQCRR